MISFRNTQHCFEPFVVCLNFNLRDVEDSQKGESCSNRGVEEQRHRQEFSWHLWTVGDGGTNVTEFKIS